MISFCLLFFLVAINAKPDIFLGENPEYGLIPIKKSTPKDSIFYWLFKSRLNRPSKTLIIWFEGGPGCSCFDALFQQVGPYRIVKNTTQYYLNPYSWNTFSDVLYTDHPIGTGLSSCPDVSRIPKTSDDTALDFYNFFINFLEKHQEYSPKNTTLYLAGHSYVGRYLPALIKLLLEKKFNYKIGGVMIGNPDTDAHSRVHAFGTYAYKNNLIGKHIYLLSTGSRYLFEIFSYLGWDSAAYVFYTLSRSIASGFFTPYFDESDIRNKHYIPDKTETIVRETILPALNITNKTWVHCNGYISKVATKFDHIRDYTSYFDNIINSRIQFIVYYGDKDFICSLDS